MRKSINDQETNKHLTVSIAKTRRPFPCTIHDNNKGVTKMAKKENKKEKSSQQETS